MTTPQHWIDRLIIAALDRLNPNGGFYRANKPRWQRWLEGKLLQVYHDRRKNEETLAVEQAQQAFIAGQAPDDAQAPR